jgi:TP901 family phage tail tape measure protein
MANKDATVRLNLAVAGFLTAIEQAQRETKAFEKEIEGIGGAAEKSGRKTSTLFGLMKTGAGGARSELSQLGGQLRNVLSQALTLGGALSVGAAVHEAQALTKSYKDIAFAIRTGTGEATSAAQVQGQIEGVADRWKIKTGEVRDAYAGLFQETGNLKFTVAATESVAKAHVATGKSVTTLTTLVGALNEKFNVPAEEMDEVLASAIELGNKGGGSLEDFANNIGEIGAIAKMAGLEGKDGFQKMAGIINIADGPLKNMRQSLTATRNMFAKLADPDSAKQIEKALGIKITDKSGAAKSDAMARILAKTKGKESELAKVFSGQELRLVTDLGKGFAEAFEKTKGDIKTKTTAGIEAYQQALVAAGKASLTAADVQKEAAQRLDDPERNLQDAINRFTKAFERPEMVHAIDQVAAAAPKLAKMLGDLVEWGTKHPLQAAGAVAGGVAAKGALTAVLTKVSDSAMDSAGKLLGKGMESSWSVGGKLAGASFVVAAGAAGYEIGKMLADYLLDRDKAKKEAGENAASTAEAMAKHGTGTTEERKAAAAALRTQIAETEKGPGIFTDTVGGWAAKIAGDSSLDPRVEQQTRLANMKAQLAALEAGGAGAKPAGLAALAAPPSSAPSLAAGGSDARKIAGEVLSAGGGDKRPGVTDHAAFAAAVARQLGSTTLRVSVVGGGGGSNGLPPAPGNNSGSTPR